MGLSIYMYTFLPRDAYAQRELLWQDVCLSVCLSHAGILSKWLNITSNVFTIQVATVSPYQTVSQYSYGDPLTGASNAREYEKIAVSTNMSLYLRNDTRYSHSYYGKRIGNLTLSNGTFFNNRECPLVHISRSRYYLQITRKLYKREQLQRKTNRKSYMFYRTVPLSTTQSVRFCCQICCGPKLFYSISIRMRRSWFLSYNTNGAKYIIQKVQYTIYNTIIDETM